MPFGLAMFAIGERRLRDKGPQARIVSFGGELHQLLFGDAQVFPAALQPGTDLGESAFDLRASHMRAEFTAR